MAKKGMLAKIIYILVGIAGLLAIIGKLGIWANPLPTLSEWLLIIGALVWGSVGLLGKNPVENLP